jgi:hypothetical protein
MKRGRYMESRRKEQAVAGRATRKALADRCLEMGSAHGPKGLVESPVHTAFSGHGHGLSYSTHLSELYDTKSVRNNGI